MPRCIVCNGNLVDPLYIGILRCRGCGHIFADLQLTYGELCDLYGKDYFFGGEYRNYIADKKIIQKNFKLRLKTLKSFLDPILHKHLLEIGCAYGFFLETARDYFDIVQGIDISTDGAEYARNQLNTNVIHGDFLYHDLGDQKFDVLCMWDTIEHLHNPQLYIEKMSRHMEPGTLLAITTGDIESLNARIKKDKWRLMHPPTHLNYFSRKTLTKMLNNFGYEVVYNQYCGFYRSINNISYTILVLHQKGPRLYNLLRKYRFFNFDVYLNLFDIMFVIACKC